MCNLNVLLLILLAPCLAAAPGDLDTTFNTNGFVLEDISAGGADRANALAVQPDGRIVVVGARDFGGSANFWIVARYNTDGSLDTGFGVGGIVPLNLGGTQDEARGLALQSDGRIVIVGRTNVNIASTGSDAAIVRLNADGTLDMTFNTIGIRIIDLGGAADTANAVVVHADGRIAFAGDDGAGLALASLFPDGSDDLNFSLDGRVTVVAAGAADEARALALDASGNLVVAGTDGVDFVVLRLNGVSGALDLTFNGTGAAITSATAGIDVLNAVAIQADGKIVAAGAADTGGSSNTALVRYNSDGTLDTTFAGTGIVITNLASVSEMISALAIQSDGNLLVAGDADDGSGRDLLLARYTPLGALDLTFGTNGFVLSDLGGALEGASGAALQADGGIVVAGRSDAMGDVDLMVARYLGSAVSPPPPPPPPTGADIALVHSGQVIPTGTTFQRADPLELDDDDVFFVLFQIENNGTGTLLLTGTPTVEITGVQGCDATIVAQPPASIAPAGAETFQVRVDPWDDDDSEGEDLSFTFSILSNDADTPSYTVTWRTEIDFDSDDGHSCSVRAGAQSWWLLWLALGGLIAMVRARRKVI